MRKQLKTLPMSEDAKKELGQLALSIWDEIGGDCLRALAESGFKKPRNVNSVTMTKRNVIEVVMDADRLEERVRHGNNAELKAMLTADYSQRSATWHKVLLTVFTYARYGM